MLLRCLQAARSEEALQTRERALRQTTLGQRCVFDNPRIGWQPGASLVLGDDVLYEGEIGFLRQNAKVEIGDRSFFGGLITCAERVTIGRDVLIARGGYISDHSAHALDFGLRSKDVVSWIHHGAKDWSNVEIAPVLIDDKAWIGWGVTILQGVTIGEGAVVGANSVVTQDVPPYTVAAGNPARVIRDLEKHLAGGAL